MKSKNRKRKIKKLLFDKKIQNNLELDRKKNVLKLQHFNNDLFKSPKVLYDSDWINAKWSGGIISSSVWMTSDEYSDKEGMELPVNIGYNFQKEWKIPKQYLPFIRPVILVDPISTDLTVYGMTPRLTYWRWRSNYKEIRGDGELLYEGYTVGRDQYYTYSQDRIDDGNILESHTSKWYKANIEWTQNDGIERKIEDAWVTTINVTYNFSHATFGGEDCPSWDYEYFSALAMDTLNSGSLYGQGGWTETYWTGSWYYGNVVWTPNNNSTKNVQKTVSILGGNSTQIACKGSYYEKESGVWVYKGIQEKTAYHGLPYAPPSDNTDFAITSFSVERAKNVDDVDLFRLWYSTTRARWFSAYDDYYWLLTNMPTSDDYEGGGMPYTAMTYEVNPDPHPVEEYPAWQQRGIDHKVSAHNPLAWIKTSQEAGEGGASVFTNPFDASRHNKYGMNISGNIYCTAPAHYNTGTTAYWVDEEYHHDGSEYDRDSENRGNKTVNRFTVEPREARLRLQLICTNPVYYEQIRKYMETS